MSLVRDQPPAAPESGARDASRRRTQYAEDLHGWALEQAALLRERRFDELDTDHLADEILDLAPYLGDKLHSDLIRIIQLLLKWDFQPDRRTRSWVLTIREHRRRVAYHLRKAPGLRTQLFELLSEAYQNARDEALRDTDLPEAAIPADCCYSWDQVTSRLIDWPERA